MGLRRFLKGAVAKPTLPGGGTDLQLHKHFRLVRQLGHGSFATVYEAERLSDGRRYALKVTDLQALGDADRSAVVEEVRLLASLTHPCIVAYHEAFADAGRLCVVTELVRGGDLGSLLAEMRSGDGFFFERELWAVFLQIALGVQYLHRNHVLHRDLKPQNIMLAQKDRRVKIVDLGVAAHLQRVFDNVMVGTPHYMAPEMWSRRAYSYSADIWALGCILHELCTLRPTFLDGGTRTEDDVRRKVLAGSYAPLPSRLSGDLSQLVAAMLQPDPKQRPTIDEILAMPQIRPRLAALPAELRQLADAAVDGPARGTAPLRRPRAAQGAHNLNSLMPASRYATGGGVADPLPRAEGQRGEGGEGSGAAEHPDAEELLQRRRSIMVGDLQHRLRLRDLGQSSGPPAAPAAAEAAAVERRPSPPPPVTADPGSSQPAEDARQGSSSRDAEPHGGGAGQGQVSIARRSVTVGQVLYHAEPEKKLGERRSPTGAEELAAHAGPFPRKPFEFLAPAAASASRRQPQPQQSEQQREQPTPRTPAAAGSGLDAEHRHASHNATKQRKQGRLWRLMYGGSSANQRTVTQ